MTPRVATTAKHMRATRNTFDFAVVPPDSMPESIEAASHFSMVCHRTCRTTGSIAPAQNDIPGLSGGQKVSGSVPKTQ